jgi:hypothetical protein
MSWYCQMVDGERRCMDWGLYRDLGWVLSKSFTVEEYLGVTTKKE